MLAPLAEVYVRRNFLAAALRRAIPWLVVLTGALCASPALGADPKVEREAQALQKKAIEEDNLNVNYAAAIKKLQTAIGKCGTDRCGNPLRAALLRDLGAMQVLNGNSDEARSSFAQALSVDGSLELDPAYKNPQIEQVWNEVKKKGGGGGAAPAAEAPPTGPAPAGQPTGDFAHTPPPEELVRTPLPIYAEYSGSEQLARVIVKYKGPGMAEWKPLELPKSGTGWGALIPCKDVLPGTMQYYIQGFNAANDPVATSGSRAKPFTVPVKQSIAGAPPGLPGQEPPKQCSETSGAGAECPPDFPGCSNKKGAGGRYRIGHAVMKDALDIDGIYESIRNAGLDLPERPRAEDLKGRLVNCFMKCEADRTGKLRGRRQIMLDDSDVPWHRHAKGAVGGVAAAAIGDPAVFVSVDAMHQGPQGGGPCIAIIDAGE